MKRCTFRTTKNVLLVIMIVLMGIPVIASTVLAADKPIEWRFFASYPPSALPLLKAFPDMVKKETNGALEIKIFFPGEHPFKGSEIITAIRDQRCQMGDIEGAYYAGIEPVLALTGTPMVAGSAESMYAMHEALLKKGVLDKVYRKYNLFEVAGWTWWGPSISAKKLINDKDSLKGQKIRVPTKQHADVVSWIGGSAVTISWNEVYTALQRGVIDGAMGALSAQRDSKWTEVCPYITRLAEAIGMDNIAINKTAFNQLSPDIKNGLLKATKELEKLQREQAQRVDALATVEIMHKNNVTVRALPAFAIAEIRKKAPAYTKEWAESAGKGAPEAYEVIADVLGWDK